MQDSNFATLEIRRVIFHDVPSNPRHGKTVPTLSEVPSTLDPTRVLHLKSRVVRALQAKSAYDITLNNEAGSPVPKIISDYTSESRTDTEFVSASQEFAKFLHEQQNGASSSGLLTIMECVSSGRSSLILLKLEREAGAQLELTKLEGKSTYSMSVLDNLVLTDGTRLFKSAMFVRDSSGCIQGVACDDQRSQGFGDIMAQFWRRFLGAEYVRDPKVATKEFFEVAVTFVNQHIADPVVKNDVYEHLMSQFKSANANFAPKNFVDAYVPDDYKVEFTSYLEEKKVPMKQFKIDITDIRGKLKRKAYRTSKGATVTIPEDEEIIVDINAEAIRVVDAVVSIN
jgi:hypothetical protein